MSEPMEIPDEAGQPVGHFSPHAEDASNRDLDAGFECPFTDEELNRFEQEPGGRSLNEILADLERRS